MNGFQDAFISYGRVDSKAFAAKLYGCLIDQGLDVWFDFEDIPLAVDYQNQINDGIEKAHNFLFIISPHSVNSPYCAKEINLALACNKRIIPIMHVEEISREIWQQRNPKGSDAEWDAYQSQGLHSSFPNIHPALAKINWVFFREGSDDFEQAFSGLLTIFERQQNYVHHHTHWLDRALTWERNQKQSLHLLIGEERQQAEAWLKTRFKNEQAPCIPTDLHCEFITESIKNANNLMTQVFLSYAEEDKSIMQQVRRFLRREGITVWTNTTDIQTGTAFQQAINRGIEEADNLVYLLSPNALKSNYCQQEIDYALSLNKRIIPFLVQEIDPTQIPPSLKDLQYIDFTGNEADYQRDESKLLKILRQDEAYYEEHKLLMAKALKWERQNRNASILLRGYNLRRAESWLNVAKQQAKYPPTALQEGLIQESLNRPEEAFLDVFISYSRADSDFARLLNDALQIQGKTTWFDQESIASGTDFQQEIYRGIESSDNFLFVISPRAINSPYCADEVEYAVKLKKRVVTVLHQSVNVTSLHPELAKVQWIDFSAASDQFYTHFSELVRTLDTDREHVRSHTKWSQRSLEWQQQKISEDLLLRGSELVMAQTWLSDSEQTQKQPAPTQAQKAFIEASTKFHQRLQKQEEERRQRELKQAHRIAIGAATGGLVMSVLAIWATAASNQAKIRQIQALVASSETHLSSNDPFRALVEGSLAGKKLQQGVFYAPVDLQKQIDGILRQALRTSKEFNRLEGHDDAVQDVSFSADGHHLATVAEDGTARLWNMQGREILTIDHQGAWLYSVSFSPDGQYLVTASENGEAYLWDLDGNEVQSFTGHAGDIYSVGFSPDGQYLATASENGEAYLWDLDGNKVQSFIGHTDAIYSVSFSPDGQYLATASADGSGRLWDLDGNAIQIFKHDAPVTNISFSPEGKTLATASDNNPIQVWNLTGETEASFSVDDVVENLSFSPDGESLAIAFAGGAVSLLNLEKNNWFDVGIHQDAVRAVSFSPDGKSLATASVDRTVRLWQLQNAGGPPTLTVDDSQAVISVGLGSSDGYLLTQSYTDSDTDIGSDVASLWDLHGNQLAVLQGNEGPISSASFSPDGQYLATILDDGDTHPAHIWDLKGNQIGALIGHRDVVTTISFSPNGESLATASLDGAAKLWDRQGNAMTTFNGHENWIYQVNFSPDGQTLATASEDGTVKLWNLKGQEIKTFNGHDYPVLGVSFSPDGQYLATASEDRTARLWQVETGQEKRLMEHTDTVNYVKFSPDGQYLVSASEDGTAHLWNLRGQELGQYRHDGASIMEGHFSADSQHLVTIDEDNVAHMWPVEEFNQLLTRSCTWTQNYLSHNPNVVQSDRHLCN